jgi:LysM repeat protein
MKRVSILLVALALCSALGARAQDAATQERLDKLSGRIEDLTAGQEDLKKQIRGLSRDLESLREQMGKPNTSYARSEDVNALIEKIKEVDQKRMDDAQKIQSELMKLRKALEAPLAQPKKKPTVAPPDTTSTAPPSTPQKGFEYVIRSGDTLDAIVQAYKEKDIKVTVSQILKANPGLKAERLRVGQKIFIPAPQP